MPLPVTISAILFYKKNNSEEAVKSYDNAIAATKDNSVKQKAFYNKGVTLQAAKKLPECINAYKNALILNPQDEDARQNLQRALKEQQKQKQQQKKQDQKKDNKKDNKKQQPKNQPQNNQEKNNNQPKPSPSKLSKQDAEEKLKSLLENEKQLQDKMHKIKGAPAPNSPEKDW